MSCSQKASQTWLLHGFQHQRGAAHPTGPRHTHSGLAGGEGLLNERSSQIRQEAQVLQVRSGVGEGPRSEIRLKASDGWTDLLGGGQVGIPTHPSRNWEGVFERL